jgi:hypothetical protein
MKTKKVYKFSEKEADRLQKEHGLTAQQIAKFRNRGNFPKTLYQGKFGIEKIPITEIEKNKVLEIVDLLSSSHFDCITDFKFYAVKKGESIIYEYELKDFKRELTELSNLLKKFRADKSVKKVQHLKLFLTNPRVHKMKFFYYKNEEYFDKYQARLICEAAINHNEILIDFKNEIDMVIDLRLQFFTF